MESAAEVDFLYASFWFAWAWGVLFILGYTKLAPWWERRPGWVACLHGVADICFTTPFLLHSVWNSVGTQSWFGWYFGGSEFLAGAIEAVRLWIVWTEIRRRRARP